MAQGQYTGIDAAFRHITLQEVICWLVIRVQVNPQCSGLKLTSRSDTPLRTTVCRTVKDSLQAFVYQSNERENQITPFEPEMVHDKRRLLTS